LYRDSRAFCAAAGDSFHGALCDLDQAEMYLDLNLSDEAEKLAWQAHGSFQQLGLGYEAAKSVAFLAMAAMQKNNFGQALELLETAQKSFVEQRNAVWPALLDIYRALSYLREGRLCEARRNTDLALTFFSHSHMPGKAIIAQLVRATLHLKTGQPMEARYWVDAARNAVEKTGTQSRHYLCEYVSGTVLEAIGSISEAHTCYQNSRAALEDLAAWHPSEELKVPFLEDKSVIYQAIFATRACTTNEVEEESGNDRAAFDLVQKAKTWGVVHGPTFRAPVRVAPENTRSAIAHRVVALREEMNWLHRRITVEELRPERTPESLEALRLKAREHESILMKTLDGLKASGEEQIGPHVAPTVSLENLRHVLPANATFLEYFEIRGVLHVCVASHKSMRIIPLTPSARAKRLVESLRARFARFERKETFHELRGHSEATVDLLKTLHGDLVAPARMLLHGDRLIIAPHQFLHGLPFHALHDGARYLIDDFSVSYAMSASTFFLSRHKTSCEPPRSLILDVLNPDGLSNIAEVSAVVSALPNPEVLSVNGGTIARAVESASHYNVVHIVQPPLRSTCAARSPDLEQGQVAAVDCSQIEWDCDLLTLGNPARAGSSADGGAELVRKASRSVQAGAGAVLMSLWNIPDPLRVSLLRDFYSLYSASGDKERSLQQAIIKLRGECPQSFGWASFILMGTAD